MARGYTPSAIGSTPSTLLQRTRCDRFSPHSLQPACCVHQRHPPARNASCSCSRYRPAARAVAPTPSVHQAPWPAGSAPPAGTRAFRWTPSTPAGVDRVEHEPDRTRPAPGCTGALAQDVNEGGVVVGRSLATAMPTVTLLWIPSVPNGNSCTAEAVRGSSGAPLHRAGDQQRRNRRRPIDAALPDRS